MVVASGVARRLCPLVVTELHEAQE